MIFLPVMFQPSAGVEGAGLVSWWIAWYVGRSGVILFDSTGDPAP